MLDVLVRARRDRQAALRQMHRLLRRQGHLPRVLVTDKLRSYLAAKRQIMPGGEHRSHKGGNNQAETHTNRPEGASALCNASSPPGICSASLPSMTRLPTCFTCLATK